MRYRIFGQRTGLKVSELALGTGMFGRTWGYGAEPDEVRRIRLGYVEAGGNFIDTADNYQLGEAERLIGELGQREFQWRVTDERLLRNRIQRQACARDRRHQRHRRSHRSTPQRCGSNGGHYGSIHPP